MNLIIYEYSKATSFPIGYSISSVFVPFFVVKTSCLVSVPNAEYSRKLADVWTMSCTA